MTNKTSKTAAQTSPVKARKVAWQVENLGLAYIAFNL